MYHMRRQRLFVDTDEALTKAVRKEGDGKYDNSHGLAQFFG